MDTTNVPLGPSEGPACQVRLSEGRACRVRCTMLDDPYQFIGRDKQARPNGHNERTPRRDLLVRSDSRGDVLVASAAEV